MTRSFCPRCMRPAADGAVYCGAACSAAAEAKIPLTPEEKAERQYRKAESFYERYGGVTRGMGSVELQRRLGVEHGDGMSSLFSHWFTSRGGKVE